MGKSKKQDRKAYDKLIAAIENLSKPQSNPAQEFLTNSAIEGANFLNKGDYSQLPKGMFLDFKRPQEQIKQYDNLLNVGNEGTAALADNGSMGNAMALASGYRKDKFARDASQNYQDNISNASANIRGALGQASNYKSGNDATLLGAMQGTLGRSPKGFNWGALLQSAIAGGSQVAAAAV